MTLGKWLRTPLTWALFRKSLTRRRVARHGFSGNMFRWIIGGDGVSYYQYYWSNVTAMDFFATAFKDDPFNGETGRKYRRMVLEKGASQDEMKTMTDFLGRDRKSDAFFEHIGLD